LSGVLGDVAVTNDRVRLQHKVTDVSLNENNHPVLSISSPKGESKETFDSVIVATTTRVMQFMGLTLNGQRQKHLLDQDIQTSLRKIHMINSSKLFIRTKEKFWKKHQGKMPQTVLSDDLFSATYMLDYPQTKNGVICVSYTWGDESAKVSGLSPEERFRLYKESIANVVPEIAKELNPVNDEILHIDWQTEPNYHGAFKLNLPGQEEDSANLYFQFQSVNDPKKNSGIYLAGDSVSWAGGWIEGALQTAINAACSVLKNEGGEVRKDSPLKIRRDRYNYK
jgi:tryptophan 2-monooxygenase